MPTPGRYARFIPAARAAFFTLHLLCIGVFALPYSTRIGPDMWKHPDARAEINALVKRLHSVVGGDVDDRVFEKRVIAVVLEYKTLVDGARDVAGLYVNAVGSAQNWNMFGGTPPLHPLVGMIHVRKKGSKKYRIWLDGHFGASGDRVFDYRHRKAQEALFLAHGNEARDDYMAYWAKRWAREHPSEHLAALRFSYAEVTTRTPAEVRAGKKPKRERRRESHTYRPKSKRKSKSKNKAKSSKGGTEPSEL